MRTQRKFHLISSILLCALTTGCVTDGNNLATSESSDASFEMSAPKPKMWETGEIVLALMTNFSASPQFGDTFVRLDIPFFPDRMTPTDTAVKQLDVLWQALSSPALADHTFEIFIPGNEPVDVATIERLSHQRALAVLDYLVGGNLSLRERVGVSANTPAEMRISERRQKDVALLYVFSHAPDAQSATDNTSRATETVVAPSIVTSPRPSPVPARPVIALSIPRHTEVHRRTNRDVLMTSERRRAQEEFGSEGRLSWQ